MRRLALLLVILGFAASQTARATVLWKGDYQTGNTSQWSNVEEAASNRIQIVTSPIFPGTKYAMQATVEPGDLIYNGARAEVDYTGDSPKEGDDRYYHWQTYFPSNYQTMNVWQIFTQWHQYVSGGSPPLAIMIWNNNIKLGNNNDVYFWTGPLQLGAWHDFIVHVKWSTSGTVGGVEMWYDGQHVLPFTNVATLFPNDTVFLKQGLYRSNAITYAQTLYHSGMTIATALSDVLPASQPDAGVTEPPDAGVGDPPDAGPADAESTGSDAGTPGKPQYSKLPYTDTFSRCTASSGVGGGWSTTGTWYCKGGYARSESAGGVAEAELTLPPSITATARVQLTGVATGSGVVVRAGSNGFYTARIDSTGSIEIDRVNNGRITQLAALSISIKENTFYSVALTVSGTSEVELAASINGRIVLSATDTAAPLASGTAGLYGGSKARTQFNNFSVKSP